MRHSFFWLHIKKSAGTSVRKLLQPYYVEVDRISQPVNFIQSDVAAYNDILNNYRVLLGPYQFKRALFARKYLYPESWQELYSFAFSREPVDRCISMFFYLYWRDLGRFGNIKRQARLQIRKRKPLFKLSYAFDEFLDDIAQVRESDSVYHPRGLHFSTHTAAMWDDVTDEQGELLLSDVFRLEDLERGINRAFAECGIDKRVERQGGRLNRNHDRKVYRPLPSQLKKIRELYAKDFDLYERSGR